MPSPMKIGIAFAVLTTVISMHKANSEIGQRDAVSTERMMIVAQDTGNLEQGRNDQAKDDDQKKDKKLSPEQKMQARFPQPVKVGALIGLPVLDGNDSTIGYIERVVRTPAGKIELIVPYAKRLGWLRNYGFTGRFRRPVPVPIEVVATMGRQVAALDMERDQFDASRTWNTGDGKAIPPAEVIKIAIQRR